MVRKAMRLPAVEDATGLKKTAIYQRIIAKKFPPPTKLDPAGRASIWWEDEIEAVQRGTWKHPETEAAA